MSIEVENLNVSIAHNTILSDLSFSCHAGEVSAIVGENGAGKSTLMNCLSGLQRYSGSIRINDRSLSEMSVQDQSRLRAVLPQNSTLNFPLDVREIVRLALCLSSLSLTEQDRVIENCLEQTDALKFIDRGYLSLSGGEQQRVQIARVLAQLQAYKLPGSRFLFLDEPTSALDLKHQYSILNMIRDLCQDHPSLGVIVILHDLNLASLYCDKILLLKNGCLIDHADPIQALSSHRIQDCFGVDVSILNHPNTKKPLLVPNL